MGFLLPAMGKEQLFKTVMADGVLPRKTFSMLGENLDSICRRVRAVFPELVVAAPAAAA